MTNTNILNILDPCPFCGGSPAIVALLADMFNIVCTKCGAKTYPYRTANAAATAWNVLLITTKEDSVEYCCGDCRRADSDGIPLLKGCPLDCHYEPINTQPVPDWQLERARAFVPDGYALVSKDALRAWGKLDEVRAMCVYPLSVTPMGDSQ